MSRDNLNTIIANLDEIAHLPDGLQRLRASILNLATSGQLLPQDASEGNGLDSLALIEADKLVRVDSVRRKTALTTPLSENELPFAVPDRWAWARLGDIAKFIDYRGKTPTKTGNGIRLITAKNVRMGYLKEHPAEFIASGDYDSWMTRGLPRLDDVLFTTEAPLANVALFNFTEPIALAQRIICLSPYKGLLGEYLTYSLMAPLLQAAIITSATGTTVSGIRATELKKIPIPIPPVSEQRRIADLLQQVFSLMRQVDRAKSEEEEARNSLTKNALRQLETKGPREVSLQELHTVVRTHRDADKLERAILGLAFRGSLVRQTSDPAPETVSDEEAEVLFAVPDTWRWSRLDAVGRIVGGSTPRSDITDAFTEDSDHGTPWFTPADLSGNRAVYVDSGRRYLTETGLRSSSAQILPQGSVLFSSRAPIGYVAILNQAAATNQGFKSFVPSDSIVTEYAYYWLRYRGPEIDAAAPSTTFREVNKKAMERQPIPVPPAEEQRRIVEKVGELMTLVGKLRARLAPPGGIVINRL